MRYSREVIITSDSSAESWSAACWDPLSGSLLTTYKNATALGPHCVSILKDSYLLAADISKPRLHLWPLNSQSPVTNVRLTTPGKVSALASSQSGSYIVAAIEGQLHIWQTSTGRLLRTVSRHYQTVTCLKFTQDGSCIASGGEDGLVFIWSIAQAINNHEDSSPKYGFSDHTLPVKDIYLSGVGTKARLVSVSLDRTARIYDVNAGKLLLTLVFRIPLISVCMDIKECNLFVGCTNGMIQQFCLRMPPRGTEFHVSEEKNSAVFHGHTGSVTCLSISIDCTTLLSGSSDGTVNIWDIPSRQIIRKIPHKGSISTAMFSPAHDNYRASLLKPKILVRPLQRIAEESGKDEIIEIISPENDSANFLDVTTYLENNCENIDTEDSSTKKLADNTYEIERLKKINQEIYKHLVNHLTSSKTEKINSDIED